MTSTITAAQRHALYDQILSRLSGIDDVRLALQQEDYDNARRLSGEFSDDLRLLVDDLGFGEGGEGPIELTSSPQILRRALARHREIAERHAAGLRSDLIEPCEEIEQDRLVCEACTAVLASLDEAPAVHRRPKLANLLPRLRQACRRGQRRSAGAAGQGPDLEQGPSAVDALRGHPLPAGAAGALQGPDPLALNRLYLSGVLLADPRPEEGRDGEPVILLLVAFPAPDAKETAERPETASCEVEVPVEVVEKHSREPRAGDSILLTGQLSGRGGVIATSLHTGAPSDQVPDVVSDELRRGAEYEKQRWEEK